MGYLRVLRLFYIFVTKVTFFKNRIVLPVISREVVNILKAGSNSSETLDLSTYGFFYGTFPTAPGVFVFATQYLIDVDLVSIL